SSIPKVSCNSPGGGGRARWRSRRTSAPRKGRSSLEARPAARAGWPWRSGEPPARGKAGEAAPCVSSTGHQPGPGGRRGVEERREASRNGMRLERERGGRVDGREASLGVVLVL